MKREKQRFLDFTPFNPDSSENVWRGDYELFTSNIEGKNRRWVGTIVNRLGNPDYFGFSKIWEMAKEYAEKKGWELGESFKIG